jgi:ATP-dependent helicase HrpA
MTPVPKDVSQRLASCMIADRHRLGRRLEALDQGRPGQVEAAAADIERSAARRASRLAQRPRIVYPADLPVVARREEIAAAIRDNQVVVLCGQTGSGKTTQLPKICLELGLGAGGMIGHTQPRRIAARTVAARIAEELGTPLGGVVGYKVRFGDKTGPGTLVKVMTDGILLAETQHDRLFEQYDTLIIDEAHERSLNIDFLLGYVRQLLPRRPDLKVIITSATIDPGRFSRHFSVGGRPAPIIEVSGRTYPVEVRYRPPPDEEVDRRDMEAEILGAVDELAGLDAPGSAGDILVFLSGEREIRETAEALRKHHPPGTEVLPLYARLSAAEQLRVFQAHRGRRIVLATNVAETSLTVPGIRYVVDTGLARISRYTARAKMQRLPVERISQASAQQRAGRCGRTSPGVCIRLYSEADFLDRAEFTDPEIVRTNLASVILQMKSLRLGDVEAFPFIEPPDARMIRDGYETLHELGAVDARRNLTRLGAEMARLPIDPRIARMVLAADAEGCLAEVLVIAAALSVQDPRDRPIDKQDQADAAHERFRDEASDFLSYLKLWEAWHERGRHLSHSKLRKWCSEGFVSFVRMREWHDTHQQLHAQVLEMGYRENREPATHDAAHRALLTGLLSNVGSKSDSFDYNGPRGVRFGIFPGSGLFKSGPKWIMAAEIVQTTRVYARTCARVQPQWIEKLGAHLVERTYSEPFWRADVMEAGAFERVTLFGLELTARRLVSYGPIDPAASRDMFIHHALIEPLLAPAPPPAGRPRAGVLDAPFVRHNRELVAQVRVLEAKSRSPDLLADTQALHGFFAERIPTTVWSPASFERWRRKAEQTDQRVLFLSRDQLIGKAVPEITPEQFPDAIQVGAASLPLEYRLDPGGPTDGITLTIPVEAVGSVEPERCEWLVPGLAVDKVVELVRALPKAYRRNFGPAAPFAERLLASAPFGEGDLRSAIAARIEQETGVHIPPDAWNEAELPAHLRMNFRVVDSGGRDLARGRDLPRLKAEVAAELDRRLAQLPGSPWVRHGITDWDFSDLPDRIEVSIRGHRIPAHPAVVDEGPSVGLRLFGSAASAEKATGAGLSRLVQLRCRDDLVHHTRGLPVLDRLAVLYAPIGQPKELRKEAIALIADRAYLSGGFNIRSRDAFEACIAAGGRRLSATTREVLDLLEEILAAHQRVSVRLGERLPEAWRPAVEDMRDQVKRLVYPGFVTLTPWEWLRHLPRYLRAVMVRLDKLPGGGLPRDSKNQELLAKFGPAPGASAGGDARTEQFRWMLEEYRVSLFAQELRTAMPVSERRLEELRRQVSV